MNAHQRRKERRRIERECRWYAARSLRLKSEGLDDAARGCRVIAVERLADVRVHLPGKRVSWWSRGGRPPDVLFSGLRDWGNRVRHHLGMFWRGRLAAELGLREATPHRLGAGGGQ